VHVPLISCKVKRMAGIVADSVVLIVCGAGERMEDVERERRLSIPRTVNHHFFSKHHNDELASGK